MARFTGATLSVVGGLVGALVVAGAVATGCGGDDNGTTTSSNTSTNKTTSSSGGTGTTSATTTTSATSAASGDGGGVKDGGPDGDATVTPPCITPVPDGGTLLFSFDDGGITMTVGTATPSWGVRADQNPLDADFDATGAGNATIGASCPGSFEITAPFTTTGQGVVGSFAYPGNGVGYTGKVIHFSLKYIIANNLDGSAAFLQELTQTDGSGFSYLTPYAQWTPPLADGGQPDANYQAQNFSQSVSGGFGGLLTDGGWLEQRVAITTTDPGDGAVIPVTTPTKFFLNQIGVQLRDPQAGADAGPQPLPFPLDLKFYIDDVWVE
jgi:hypothetical protein